jgi:membrane protease YdiL (CAAX protease family)
MIWIAIYIVLVNIGNYISKIAGKENSVTTPILIALSLYLLYYLKNNNWFEYYGYSKLSKNDLKKSLFFFPLFILSFIQNFKGFRAELDIVDIILGIALMVCVGFLEELIFRGFLYQGILKKSNISRAITISVLSAGLSR